MTREEATAYWKQRSKHIHNWLEENEDVDFIGEYVEAIDMAIEALQARQEADRSYGEWVDEDGNKVPLDKDGYPLGSCWCNQCHEWLVGSDEYAIKGNFCPNCGVKMKGANDEID